MDLNDDELKSLYRTYVAGQKEDSRKDCPSMEKLLSFFEAHKRTRKKKRIVDHITRCSACAKEFEFMLEVQRYECRLALRLQETPSEEPSPLPSGIITPLFWKFTSSVVGMVLVVVSLGIIFKELRREDLTRATRSGIELIQPKPGRPVTPPLIFKWQPTAMATTYILELYDDSLLPFWKSTETSATTIVLPDDVTARLQPDQVYYWMVTAYGRDGKLAESGFYRFSIPRQEP